MRCAILEYRVKRPCKHVQYARLIQDDCFQKRRDGLTRLLPLTFLSCERRTYSSEIILAMRG